MTFAGSELVRETVNFVLNRRKWLKHPGYPNITTYAIGVSIHRLKFTYCLAFGTFC